MTHPYTRYTPDITEVQYVHMSILSPTDCRILSQKVTAVDRPMGGELKHLQKQN